MRGNVLSVRAKTVMRHVAGYSTANVLKQLITLAAAILTRRFLGPLQFGIWSVLQVVLNYAKFSNLGIAKGAIRQIPFLRGRKSFDEAEEVKNVSFSVTLLMSLVIAVGILIFAFLSQDRLRPELFYGLLMVSGFVLLQHLNNIFIEFLWAYKEFRIASKQMVISSIFNAIVIAFMSYHFKIYGYMWGMAASFIFNLCYILWQHAFHIRWRVDFRVVAGLISYGFPLMMVALLNTVFITVDRVMIASFLGFEAVGLYSIAILALNSVANLVNSVGVVMVPNPMRINTMFRDSAEINETISTGKRVKWRRIVTMNCS